MFLILSWPADTICQKPLFTLSWMSARAIKLFVVLAREKRVPYDTTFATRVLFLYARNKRDPRLPRLFLSFLTRGNVQTETAGLKSLSSLPLFSSSRSFFLYYFWSCYSKWERYFLTARASLLSGFRSKPQWNTDNKVYKEYAWNITNNILHARVINYYIQSIDKF